MTMNRKEFWGKKQCKLFDLSLPRFQLTLQTDVGQHQEDELVGQMILLNPISQIRWISTGSLCDREISEDQLEPWNKINSASRAMSLDINWSNVVATAIQEEEEKGSNFSFDDFNAALEKAQPEFCQVSVFQHEAGGWQAADPSSLERIVASALLNNTVAATVVARAAAAPVPHDASKIAPLEGDPGAAAPGGLDPVLAALKKEQPGSVPSRRRRVEEGWTLVARDGKRKERAVVRIDPAVIMSSRNLQTCTWPKVWHFAKMVLASEGGGGGGDGDDGVLERLSPVPLKWDATRGWWVSGNRHRVMACRLLERPFYGEIRTRQPTAWKFTLRDGVWDRSPARYWELPRQQDHEEGLLTQPSLR